MQDLTEAVKLVHDAEAQERDMKHLAQVRSFLFDRSPLLLNMTPVSKDDANESQRSLEVVPEKDYRPGENTVQLPTDRA